MEQLIRIGVDTSKCFFQLHGVDQAEQPVLRKKLARHQLGEFFQRLPPTVVAMEACGGARHWARELTRMGHTVRLIAPQLAKPHVKRGGGQGEIGRQTAGGRSRWCSIRLTRESSSLMRTPWPTTEA